MTFLFSNLLLALARVMGLLIQLYNFVIGASVLVSWLRPDPYHPLVGLLHQLTEPVYSRVRKIIPFSLNTSGIDWTPMVVIILLQLLDTVVVKTLYEIAMSAR